MDIRIITGPQVYQLLPMKKCISLMAETLETFAEGGSLNPLRTAMWFPDKSGLLGVMPGYLKTPECTGLKVVSVMPGNHGTGHDSHQGMVMLFETKYGCPLAMIDASAITAIRTAAASAVATDLLARKDAATLALLGSGVQAETHLEAMLAVRNISNAAVWSATAANAERFAGEASDKYQLPVQAKATAHEAVSEADIICTITAAKEPVLHGDWIQPGAHINAVGACFRAFRELDTAAVANARLYIDCRESTLNEAGDFLIPQAEGVIDESHIIGEIGEILAGKINARETENEITLFKSLGIALEDLGAAWHIYQEAERSGIGTTVALT